MELIRISEILGFRVASEAEARSQVQILLEHLPPRRRIHSDHPQRHQRVRGIRCIERAEELEESVHRRDHLLGRRRRSLGSLYVVHRAQAAEGQQATPYTAPRRQWS